MALDIKVDDEVMLHTFQNSFFQRWNFFPMKILPMGRSTKASGAYILARKMCLSEGEQMIPPALCRDEAEPEKLCLCPFKGWGRRKVAK